MLTWPIDREVEEKKKLNILCEWLAQLSIKSFSLKNN